MLKRFKFLKNSILVLLLLFSIVHSVNAKRYSSGYSGTGSNSKSTYVHGYTKKNGTHVNGYHRTKANGTQRDNYSAEGNINPYTGKVGHKKAKH
jgi:hypothetical protein